MLLQDSLPSAVLWMGLDFFFLNTKNTKTKPKDTHSRKRGLAVYTRFGKLPTISLTILNKLWVRYDDSIPNVFTQTLVPWLFGVFLLFVVF